MDVAATAVGTTAPASSEGVVAAGVYVDGRRVANIAICGNEKRHSVTVSSAIALHG